MTMIRFTSIAVLVASLITLPAANAQDSLQFRRGVSIHDAMNWASMEPGNTRYVFPPFSDAKHSLTPDELTIIHKAGFTFVRLTIDPGPFLQFQGQQLDTTYNILRQRVQMILGAGLAVDVDFHPVSQDPEYVAKVFVQGVETPMFRAYCGALARTAHLLEGMNSDRVALEIMNEPPIGWNPTADAQWQQIEEHAYKAIRSTAPRLMLILSGDHSGDQQGLSTLDGRPFRDDKAVIFTFHYYEPHEFTHQSAPNNPDQRLAADLPYPANARSFSDEIAALRERVDKLDASSPAQKAADMTRGMAQLVNYQQLNFNRDTIKSDFDHVTDWEHKNGIPPERILLGEFGVLRKYGKYDGAFDTDRARWLHDVREEAESHGFLWSIWAYRGYGGFAIVKDDSTNEIDPVTRQALGFK
jgi:endoglucanase